TTVNDGHHHPQQPSMAHNNPGMPRNNKKDAWAPCQQVNEQGRRFVLVPCCYCRRCGNQTRNDDIESLFLVVFSFTMDSDGEGVLRRRGTTKTACNDNTVHRQHLTHHHYPPTVTTAHHHSPLMATSAHHHTT
ncbi:hypothetical protein K443DRAFT_56268, partial [Laccaria amethystina LaAM-08-1]